MTAVSAVELDFQEKRECPLEVAGIRAAMAAGRFVWIDVRVEDEDEARGFLRGLELVLEDVVEDALTGAPATQTSRYHDYDHHVVTGCRLHEREFELQRVDAIMGAGFLLTIQRGSVGFMDAVRRQYKADFVRFARSPSFLVYEIWDHLIENYLNVQKQFEERVEQMQAALVEQVDEAVFRRVSALGSDLLHFRKVLLPARAVLSEISTRKSLFISEATQPFLANMVGTVERVLQDLIVDREILSESLNLHMTMVGHQTNRVMNKLTVVSLIFMPLTFLCGVYGMNFDVLPELKWELGYLYFWMTVGSIVGLLLWIMKKNKLL